MNVAKLATILTSLPEPGRRLSGGLALRISSGNGMHILGCSRIGTRPSTVEMQVMVEAVVMAFEPSVIFQADDVDYRPASDDYVWRLYWPMESVAEAWRPQRAEQGAFFE